MLRGTSFNHMAFSSHLEKVKQAVLGNVVV